MSSLINTQIANSCLASYLPHFALMRLSLESLSPDHLGSWQTLSLRGRKKKKGLAKKMGAELFARAPGKGRERSPFVGSPPRLSILGPGNWIHKQNLTLFKGFGYRKF